MSRTISNTVFLLIQSLNKNEKRHFKLFMSTIKTEEIKKVIILFDAIAKQKKYNEEKILTLFPMLEKQQLPNLKSYLQDKILQALRIYNSSRFIDMQIRQLIDYTQLLFERRLLRSGKDYLAKAKRLAESHGRLELLLDIIRIERGVILDTLDSENIHKVDDAIIEIKKINSQISNINLFSNLTLKFDYFFAKIGSVRNENDFHSVENFYKENVPAIQEESLSINEKIYYFQFHISYFSYIRDFEKNYFYAFRLISLFHANIILITQKPETYLKAINLVLIVQYHLLKVEDFKTTLNELKTYLHTNSSRMAENILFKGLKYISVHEINSYFLEGSFTNGVAKILKNHTLEDLLQKSDKQSQLIFYYKIACLYFGSGNFNMTVKWLNKIINEPQSDLREDLQCFARIINLISHYELENYDVINYYIISTYRFLLKKSDLHLFQKYIINFLRRLGSGTEEYQLNSLFKELKLQLIPLITSRFENRAFDYFDIISWLESKIEKIPVEKIVQRKCEIRKNSCSIVAL